MCLPSEYASLTTILHHVLSLTQIFSVDDNRKPSLGRAKPDSEDGMGSLNGFVQLKLMLHPNFELIPEEIARWASRPDLVTVRRHVELARIVRAREEQVLDAVELRLPSFTSQSRLYLPKEKAHKLMSLTQGTCLTSSRQ